MSSKKTLLLPLDRAAIATILILVLCLGILVAQGDVVRASVRDFSWENKYVGADDISFSLIFNRPMDNQSVEKNLKIEPPLLGKFSWVGRRMVYTLEYPAPYGSKFQISLDNAQDKFAKQKSEKRTIKPFRSEFRTRDRAIAYIGVQTQKPDPEGKKLVVDNQEKGRLVVYNLTQEKKQILTPPDLVVMDFQPYPDGSRILFSARPSHDINPLSAKIYSVTTGISPQPDSEPEPPGRIDLMVDSKEYQNLKFDLSPDGKTIVVQRGKANNPGDVGLWFMSAQPPNPGEKPQLKRIETAPTGDFMITPDSSAVAVSQGEGAAIIPIQEDANKPLDFLPQFGVVQSFAKDGSKAAMVSFNRDFTNPTQSLFLVNNQGQQKELLKIPGSIIDSQFDPAAPVLYTLISQLVPGEQYIEQPYLISINLKTNKQTPLVVFPPGQRNIKMSLAPDGVGLLFDQVIPQNPNLPPSKNTPRTKEGEVIDSSSLWLMPVAPDLSSISTTEIKPQQLPFAGFYPQWLP